MTKTDGPQGADPRQRADQWLWQARFFKTRRRASDLVAAGRVRANGVHLRKASSTLKPGDVLTFPQGRSIRVVRVLALAQRRGPAREARELYEDLTPPELAERDLESQGARPE